MRFQNKIILPLLFLSLTISCVFANSSSSASLEEYINEVQKSIKSNWHPKKSDKSYTVITKFKIDQLGKVKDIGFIKSNSDEKVNQLAINAIKNSEPFTRPESLKTLADIEVEFTFDYSIKTIATKQERQTDNNTNLPVPDSVLNNTKNTTTIHPILKFTKLLLGLVFVLFILRLKIIRFLNQRVVEGRNITKNKQNEPSNKAMPYDPTNVKK